MVENISLVETQDKERKSLNVRRETWEKLQTFGKYGDSVDDILNRLMETATTQKDKKARKK